MRLLTRLERLEQGAQRDAPHRPCAACGGRVDWERCAPAPAAASIRVLQPGELPSVPDVCPLCRRQLVIRVRFDSGGTARVALLAALCVLAGLAAALAWSWS